MSDRDQPGTWDSLRDGSRFFVGEGPVHETLRRLARRLAEEGIDYTLAGGMALFIHGFRRFTEDIDIVLRGEDLDRFRARLVEAGYRPAFEGATRAFRDNETGVVVEILASGDFPGDGLAKPVAVPDPASSREDHGGLPVLPLAKLIELKLASGLSAPSRLKDLADVQELIVRLALPLDLADRLDASVADEFRRLWHAAHGTAPGA
jgi:hypothetical protein